MTPSSAETSKTRGRVRIEQAPSGSARTSAARSSRTPPARCSSGRCPTTPPTTSRSRTCAPSCSPTAAASTRRAAATRRTFTVSAGGREARGAALRYADSPLEELRELVRLDWDAMDAWFEEDEEVFTHPRDPYTRVDILASSRHVRVEVDGRHGRRVAEPAAAVRDRPAGRATTSPRRTCGWTCSADRHVSHCPYKGEAEWWSVRAPDGVHADLAWSYPTPLPESQKIAGLVAFYDEKVDIYVDGVAAGAAADEVLLSVGAGVP